MEIVKIKTSKIKLNEDNPRTIKDSNFQNLVKSVKDFPQMLEIRPIVVDENMIVLGGNMRFRACLEAGMKEVPVIVAKNLSEEQKLEFIIKDNVSGGDWDWNVLVNEWNVDLLTDWGLDVGGYDVNPDALGEDFNLASGEKSPFQQITFTLADEQATIIKNALDDIKDTDEFKYCETMGNENSNGNALYLLITQWNTLRTNN